jgi:hypothetical protein
MKTRYVIGIILGAMLIVGALEEPAHSEDRLIGCGCDTGPVDFAYAEDDLWCLAIEPVTAEIQSRFDATDGTDWGLESEAADICVDILHAEYERRFGDDDRQLAAMD